MLDIDCQRFHVFHSIHAAIHALFICKYEPVQSHAISHWASICRSFTISRELFWVGPVVVCDHTIRGNILVIQEDVQRTSVFRSRELSIIHPSTDSSKTLKGDGERQTSGNIFESLGMLSYDFCYNLILTSNHILWCPRSTARPLRPFQATLEINAMYRGI